MSMEQDEQYLRRAIRLAMKGRGSVEPNPMVGCVIVKADRIIGEGYHARFGDAHAEPTALAHCTESPEGATAYVTLEPCCHTNKKTPPCVPGLIAAKIARVVIGCLDPNPSVNGNGVNQLCQAGIAVDGPMLENEARQLIAPFIARTRESRPYLTMKWAQTADGKIAGPNGTRIQISNPTTSHLVQLLRARCDAIVVGINTVLNDDPVLVPRDVPMLRPYRRFILDRHLRLPTHSMLVKTIDKAPVIVCSDRTSQSGPAQMLAHAGVQVSPADAWLHDPDLTYVLIEAGPTLARALLPRIDRLWVIRSPIIVGNETAPSAANIPDYFIKTGEVDLDGDQLCEYLNTKSTAFFTAAASADFVPLQIEPGPAGADRDDSSRL